MKGRSARCPWSPPPCLRPSWSRVSAARRPPTDRRPSTCPPGSPGRAWRRAGWARSTPARALDGRVARGDLRAGTSEVFVDEPLVGAATGLKADLRHDLLWVSGAATGQAAVYDLDTGEGITALTLATAPSFINDVVVTRDAAYFTNSLTPVIYKVPVSRRGEIGPPETIMLSGPAAEFVPGFNLNGIDATIDGRTLIVVNSAKGLLYTVDARTGASAEIDLGGATVPTGDGILLVGPILLVLQNGGQTGVNQVAVVLLHSRLTKGADRGHLHQPAVRDGDDAGAQRADTRRRQRPVQAAAADRSRIRGRPAPSV